MNMQEEGTMSNFYRKEKIFLYNEEIKLSHYQTEDT